MGARPSLAKKWPLADAWDAAAAAAASLYDVAPDLLRAPSRGRGPRPPQETWEAKKVALYLTVLLSDGGCAALGRHLGFHRDTIASACAEVRGALAVDDAFEVTVSTVEQFMRARLSVEATKRLEAARRQLAQIEAFTRDAFDAGSDASTDAFRNRHPTRPQPSHKRDHTDEEAA